MRWQDNVPMFEGDVPESTAEDLDLGYVRVITQTEAAIRLGMIKRQVNAIPRSLLPQLYSDRPLSDSWDPLYLDTDVERLRTTMGLPPNPLASDIYNQEADPAAQVIEELANALDELDHQIKATPPQSITSPQQGMARHALEVIFDTCHALTYAMRNLELSGLDARASSSWMTDLEEVQDLLASIYHQLSENFNLGFIEMDVSRAHLTLNEIVAGIRSMTD